MAKKILIGIIIAIILLTGLVFIIAYQKNENVMHYKSIMDAMLSNKKIKCTYTTRLDSNIINHNEVIVEGKKYSHIATFSDTNGFTKELFNGKTHYIWTDSKKDITLDSDCTNSVGKSIEEEAIPEAYLTADTAVNCVSINVVDFSVPNNVEFKDGCESFKKYNK